ncbi:hypothetical protein [Dactylosporangium sp. NPDC051484]|uniref:hypothetical protein n=1 Tax=Dactylosporangium sp. NPDC051484 TaxID=3154942 RepID=UPI00344C8928
MTSVEMPLPILGEAEPRPVVELPAAVPVEESRSRRVLDAAGRGVTVAVGDVREAWIFHGTPPTVADIVAVRVPDWEPFERFRHRCFDRTEGMIEVDAGWTCECTPVADEVRKANTRDIRIVKGVRVAWIIYNHVVAIPATVLLYVAAWIVQHPGRLLLAAILVLVFAGLVFG